MKRSLRTSTNLEAIWNRTPAHRIYSGAAAEVDRPDLRRTKTNGTDGLVELLERTGDTAVEELNHTGS